MGLGCVLHHALASGGTVISLARFDLEVMLRAMAAHGVSQALVAPPLLAALARHPAVASFDLSALRVVGSGGAPARPRSSAPPPSGSDVSSARATG